MHRYSCLFALVAWGCTSTGAEGSATGGKADDSSGSTICGLATGAVESLGAGEVGELDTDPRLTANATAAQINASRDCQHQIDACAVPHYQISDDGERVVVEIATSELVMARQLYINATLAAEERPGLGCTVDPGECCRVCVGSQACGDSCIANDLTCSQPAGCACQR